MTKFFGCATGVACALVLSSCGSDSSNGPGSDVSKTKISIDELNRTITSYENESYDFCVYDSVGNRFDWKRNMVTELDTFEIHYLFKGDTLVLFEEGDEGIVLVGGKANSLYGTWKGLKYCNYDSDVDEIDCANVSDFSNIYYQITFHKNFVETEVVYSLPDDYTNSAWMSCFYDGLNAKRISFNPRYVFVSDTVSAEMLQELGIEIKSQSKSKISFVFGEKNVSVEFADVTGDAHNFSYTAKVRVDDKTCSLLLASTNEVSENLCSIENADYFDLEEYESSDSSFVYANRYDRDNSDEFFECLNTAFGFAGETVDGGISLYKKQDRASIRDANWNRMERIARKLSGSVN